MNWNGGARARAQQNQGGFIPSRRQQQARRSGAQDVLQNDDGNGNIPPGGPIRRLPYSGYDVASDPRYELVTRNSEDVRYRTVPLLETVKSIFANGDVLSLQLSHQMEIHKIRNNAADDRRLRQDVFRYVPNRYVPSTDGSFSFASQSENNVDENRMDTEYRSESDYHDEDIRSESDESFRIITQNRSRSAVTMESGLQDNQHKNQRPSNSRNSFSSCENRSKTVDSRKVTSDMDEMDDDEEEVFTSSSTKRARLDLEMNEKRNVSVPSRPPSSRPPETVTSTSASLSETWHESAVGRTGFGIQVEPTNCGDGDQREIFVAPLSDLRLRAAITSEAAVRGTTPASINSSQHSQLSMASGKSVWDIVEAVYSPSSAHSSSSCESVSEYFAADYCQSSSSQSSASSGSGSVSEYFATDKELSPIPKTTPSSKDVSTKPTTC